ncbi:MAG: hypothetical protein ABI072_07540 [Edaphobacter sp.]
MPDFDPKFDSQHDPLNETQEEMLPKGLRPSPPCPPLELLLAHRGDVLPPEAAPEVSRHLEHCGLCRTLLADLDQLPQPGLTQHERDRIYSKLPIPHPAFYGKRWWFAGIAVAAAVLLVGVFFALRPISVQPAQNAQTTQPNLPKATPPRQEKPLVEVAKLAPPIELAPELVLRGGAPSDQPDASQLAPAFEAYGSNDYPTAAGRFRLLAKRYPRADVPLLYLGVTQLLMQDNQSALTSLTRADSLATNARKDAASWYHAVAALQTHSPEAATLLHDLCRRKQSQYAKQACALEEKL